MGFKGFKTLVPVPDAPDKFVLDTGNSGNTTFILDKKYPAGNYLVNFASGDTTYDIYAIAVDGTPAGYTNTTTLTTSKDFKEIVVLGFVNNDDISFDGIVSENIVATSKGDVASAGAFITSVSVSSLPNADDTTTITGGNFATDVEVYFTGQDSVELAAKSLTRNSSTELVATRPDALDADDSPYTVKVVNPGVTEPTGSSAHLLPNSITAGANPSWVTVAAQEYNPTTAVTITLSATDADGTVSYSLQSGTLPGGLSLNGSTGEISGTPTTSDGDVNVFTIRATDEGGNFVDREFTFTAVVPTIIIDYLIVAGGGSGASNGGGGGAGGYRSFSSQEVTPSTNYTVTVGAGGASAISTQGNDGSSSVFNTSTSTGGGGGGGSSQVNGRDGGSGGGAGYTGSPGSGNVPATTPSQGNDGGYDQTDLATYTNMGGGGGASQVGQNGTSSKGGDGGDGSASSITGVSVIYAGGGGGGGQQGPAGTGGAGGGGHGAVSSTVGSAGAPNTGGGGGGSGSSNVQSGNGGSGVVIIRYPDTLSITIGAGLTGSTTTVDSDKVTTITAGTGNVSWAVA